MPLQSPLTHKSLYSQVDVLVARGMARSRWWEMWADRATEPKPPISQYWRQLRRLRSANFFTPWEVGASRNSFVISVLKFVFCKNTYLDLIVFGPPWAQKMAGLAFDFWKTLWLFDIIGQLRLKQLLAKRIFLGGGSGGGGWWFRWVGGNSFCLYLFKCVWLFTYFNNRACREFCIISRNQFVVLGRPVRPLGPSHQTSSQHLLRYHQHYCTISIM